MTDQTLRVDRLLHWGCVLFTGLGVLGSVAPSALALPGYHQPRRTVIYSNPFPHSLGSQIHGTTGYRGLRHRGGINPGVIIINRPVYPGHSLGINRPVYPGHSLGINRPVYPGRSLGINRPVYPGRSLGTNRPVYPGHSFPRSYRRPSYSTYPNYPIYPGIDTFSVQTKVRPSPEIYVDPQYGVRFRQPADY